MRKGNVKAVLKSQEQQRPQIINDSLGNVSEIAGIESVFISKLHIHILVILVRERSGRLIGQPAARSIIFLQNDCYNILQ